MNMFTHKFSTSSKNILKFILNINSLLGCRNYYLSDRTEIIHKKGTPATLPECHVMSCHPQGVAPLGYPNQLMSCHNEP